MNQKENHERQHNCALAAAMLVPLSQTASRSSWLAVLAAGAGVLLLCRWLMKYTAAPAPWLAKLQNLWACVIVSELLYWSVECWPGHDNRYAVPLILLVLAVWLSGSGLRRAESVGCTLLWPVGLILGAVLLSALPDMEWKDLTPSWQMTESHLLTLLVAAMLHGRSEKRGSGTGVICAWVFALLATAITAGVLSPAVCAVSAPVYELSRSIGLFGIAERFESITAAAMTMGYFAAISYLLAAGNRADGNRSAVWGYGGLAALLFIGNIRLDSRIVTIGSILLWIILPAACGLKNIFQKTPKPS